MFANWRHIELGDACVIVNGKNQKAVEDPAGRYPIYGSGGIMGYASKYLCKAGSTIIGRKGTINKPLYVDTDFWNVDTAFGLCPKENVEPRFFFHLCRSINWLKYNKSTTLPSLVKSDLLKIPVAIPCPDEQKHISSELDILQRILDLKDQQLKDFEKACQSLFYECFGDPLVNDMNWPTKQVIDVVKLQRGYDLPVQDRDSSGSVPVYGSNGIIGKHSDSKIEEGIITGRSGTIGLVYCSETPFWPLNTTLFSVDCHGNNVKYLKYLLTSFHLERFASGAGVPTLNRNAFHGEQIIDVPVKKQKEFTKAIEEIEGKMDEVRQSMADCKMLLASRMDYWFN